MDGEQKESQSFFLVRDFFPDYMIMMIKKSGKSLEGVFFQKAWGDSI